MLTGGDDDDVPQHTTIGLPKSLIANNFAGLPADGTSANLLADEQHELLLQATVAVHSDTSHTRDDREEEVQEESEEALGRDRQEEVQEEKEEVDGAEARGGAMRKRGISFAVLTAVTSSLVVAGSAQASFHLNLIREVHEGGATGDYVELQAYAAGENLVGGKYVNTYDGGGGSMTSTLIPANVPNGANQATILIAHDASTPGADVVNAGLNVVNTGGTVCYSTSPVGTAPALDCVAYTSGPTAFPTPPPSPYGTPVVPARWRSDRQHLGAVDLARLSDRARHRRRHRQQRCRLHGGHRNPARQFSATDGDRLPPWCWCDDEEEVQEAAQEEPAHIRPRRRSAKGSTTSAAHIAQGGAMGTRRKMFGAVFGTALIALLVSAGSASASFHLIKIRSIFRSPSASGAFIELQMYADGQNLVGGHTIRVCPPNGIICSVFVLPSNVANAQNQRRILVGDSTAPGLPDFTLPGLGTSLTNSPPEVPPAGTRSIASPGARSRGRRICPAPPGPQSRAASAAQWSASATSLAGCPTALDEADDTNNSAADFGFAVGYPLHNNSVTPSEVLCPPTPMPTTTKTKTKKCKKHKKKKSGAYSAKKKCKKHKKK